MDFSRRLVYRGVDLGARVELLVDHSIPKWQELGLIRDNKSFGMSVGSLELGGCFNAIWDDPAQLAGFTYGWGPEAERYIWNAIRKERAIARVGISTFDLANRPKLGLFKNPVDSTSSIGDKYPWGDFPYPGAVILGHGHTKQLVGVSSLDALEDHWVALMLAGFIMGEMIKLDRSVSVGS